MSDLSRRHFFFGSLLAGAVPVAGFGSSPSLKLLGYKSPNQKLNIASIGAGGRAASDIHGCSSENMVAFADPDWNRAAKTFDAFPKTTRYKDFRKMFDKEAKNIDAVIVAIPDHMHATAAMWAMERGKHVYCEKPLTHTIWEARRLTESAAKYGVATQMGNQGYSNDGNRIAAEIIWSGAIGDVTEVHAWTNRPVWTQGKTEPPPEAPVPDTMDWDTWIGVASMRPYSPEIAPFNWRGFFDFGCGAIGDMALHILGAVNMALQLTAPTSVEVIKQEGKSPIMFPSRSVTRFDFPQRGAFAPVKIFWYDAAVTTMYQPAGVPAEERIIGGPGSWGEAQTRPQKDDYERAASGAPKKPAPGTMTIEGRTYPSGPEANGAVFVGTNGFITTDTYGANVRMLPYERMKDYKLPPELLTRSPEHHMDWIRACKGGDPGCSDFKVTGPFTEWLLTGSVALHFDGKLEWDSAKMRFTNNSDATEMVKPKFRKGWQWS